MRLVLDYTPRLGNGRNSEGSFIRMPDGGILFAFSRYSSDTAQDHDSCDIAAIRSYDEGETWSDPEVIVKAASFGVANIMSVSCIYQADGRIGVYFLIKENDRTSNMGRALSEDGKTFVWERCTHDACQTYYVVNNDRVERLSNGKLVIPAALHLLDSGKYSSYSESVLWVSDDDGKTFHVLPHRINLPKVKKQDVGMQEPGILEHKDGSIRVWARTKQDSQYECYSYDGMETFTYPAPSFFTSPCSPMEMARNEETGILYAVHNPYPESKLANRGTSWGRTPLVIRKSLDDGKTWSMPTVIEDDRHSGYCYPALFFTKDHSLLCAYCRGGAQDPNCLSRLGIMKMDLDEIED